MNGIDRVDLVAALGPARGAAGGAGPAPTATMEEAVRDFEALLLHQSLKGATRPFAEGGVFDGGSAGRLFRDLFFEEVARLAVQDRGLGMATALADRADGDAEQAGPR